VNSRATDLRSSVGVGFVAQDTPTHPRRSIAKHLRMGAWLNPGWDSELAERRIEELGLDVLIHEVLVRDPVERTGVSLNDCVPNRTQRYREGRQSLLAVNHEEGRQSRWGRRWGEDEASDEVARHACLRLNTWQQQFVLTHDVTPQLGVVLLSPCIGALKQGNPELLHPTD
jgi:hypothetical protein